MSCFLNNVIMQQLGFPSTFYYAVAKELCGFSRVFHLFFPSTLLRYTVVKVLSGVFRVLLSSCYGMNFKVVLYN